MAIQKMESPGPGKNVLTEIDGTVVDLQTTSPSLNQVKLDGARLLLDDFNVGGTVTGVKLPAGIGAVSPAKEFWNNVFIALEAVSCVGISHLSGYANFPLYNSAIVGFGTSLNNVTLAAGNASNYIV